LSVERLRQGRWAEREEGLRVKAARVMELAQVKVAMATERALLTSERRQAQQLRSKQVEERE
jgi:hypothetical protein